MKISDFRKQLIKSKIGFRWLVYQLQDKWITRRQLTCPICDHSGDASNFPIHTSQDIFWGGKIVRHECANCGVIFGSQRMLRIAADDAELARELRELYSVYSEGDTTEAELKAFHALKPTVNGTYLNYGSGQWSRAIETLRSQGYQVYGFESYVGNPDDKHIIKDMDVLRKMRFDGIMSHNLMEHLRYPDQTLSLLKGLLTNDSARMAHSTPCFRYEIEYTRFHLFFYTGRSLQVIAQKAGLDVHDTDNPDIKVFTPSRP
jgi:hypothetical protein